MGLTSDVVVESRDGPSTTRSFSTFVAACFTLNYVMGTGVLALPWAFHEAGVVLTCASLVLVCVVGVVSVDYLLTAMARAGALADQHAESLSSSSDRRAESTPLVVGIPRGDAGKTTTTTTKTPLLVGDRRFELTDLCRVFLGRTGERALGAAVVVYLYGALWAYATVFGKAAARSVPGERWGWDSRGRGWYACQVLVFACVVVPMSFLELGEQIVAQLFLSTCRFVMVVVLVVSPLCVAWSSSEEEDEEEGRYSFGGATTPEGYDAAWRPSGVPRMLPVAVFSVIFHCGLPGLAAEARDKSRLHRVFGLTLTLCVASYALVGAVDSWFFGPRVAQSVNLNWSDFRHDGDDRWGAARIIAPAVSFYTVVFPALDVVSAFPLNAVALSSNLRTLVEGGGGKPPSSSSSSSTKKADRWFRFVASVPPVVGALFVDDLGAVTDFTGLIGFLVAFCFPALLYASSERTLRARGLPTVTAYQRFGSSTESAAAMFIFGASAAAYTCWHYVVKQ